MAANTVVPVLGGYQIWFSDIIMQLMLGILLLTSLLMTFINVLIIAIWQSRQAFFVGMWAHFELIYYRYHTLNVMGENTVLQINILETVVLTLMVQNSSPKRLCHVGDEF